MISIIIPAYNHPERLRACLESILDQTIIPRSTALTEQADTVEIIVVNDGSTENIGGVIDEIKPKYLSLGIKFQYVTQENQGAPSARNKGASLSSGEFLLFCDLDIRMRSDMLEKMLLALSSHPEASYAYSSFTWGRKLFRLWPFDGERLKTMPYIHTTSLIRREHFPGFDISLKRFQDWDLWLIMLERGHTGYWIDETLYKIDTGGTMSNWIPSFIYRLMPFLPSVKNYQSAKNIIQDKHGLKE